MDSKALIATAVRLSDVCGDYESLVLWKKRGADNKLHWFLVLRYHYYQTEYNTVAKLTVEQARMLEEKLGLAYRLYNDQEWEIEDESYQSSESK